MLIVNLCCKIYQTVRPRDISIYRTREAGGCTQMLTGKRGFVNMSKLGEHVAPRKPNISDTVYLVADTI